MFAYQKITALPQEKNESYKFLNEVSKQKFPSNIEDSCNWLEKYRHTSGGIKEKSRETPERISIA